MNWGTLVLGLLVLAIVLTVLVKILKAVDIPGSPHGQLGLGVGLVLVVSMLVGAFFGTFPPIAALAAPVWGKIGIVLESPVPGTNGAAGPAAPGTPQQAQGTAKPLPLDVEPDPSKFEWKGANVTLKTGAIPRAGLEAVFVFELPPGVSQNKTRIVPYNAVTQVQVGAATKVEVMLQEATSPAYPLGRTSHTVEIIKQ